LNLLRPGGADTYDDVNRNDLMAFVGEVLHYGTGFVQSWSMNPAEDGTLG
jgi:hypothetical protein